MSLDLSKVTFASVANAFKNDDQVYTGSIQLPGSLSPSQIYVATQAITLSTAPAYSKFFAYCWELADLNQALYVGSGYIGQTWYPANVGGNAGIGVQITAPATAAGVTQVSVYPVISGTTITVTLLLPNPYNVTVTLNAYTIPWAFVEYSLAN